MRNLTERDKRAATWVTNNRGQMSKIGREVRPPVTAQFVHQVLRGRRRSEDGRVERALRAAGAPVERPN